MKISLPYGKDKVSCQLPDERVIGVLCNESIKAQPESEPEAIVTCAMDKPYGTPPLWELAKGKDRVVLIASDHTRPVPSKVIVPQMLAQIRKGNPHAQITILIATGCHRETTREELVEKFGEQIVEEENIAIHDCDDEDLVFLGKLPSGGDLHINRLAAEADLLVAEGFIEPHFFAGFSGGRKSILPGIASRTCVRYNHNSGFMDSTNARAGVLEGNPVHADMLFAAKQANLAYIVNVVLNTHGQVIAAFAGDCENAHEAGTRFVLEKMSCPAEPTDIVITTNNGYPLDQNLYQMVKGMCTAEGCCRDGGVIIAVGKCGDGIGGETFYRMFKEQPDPSAMLEEFRALAPENTQIDQWQAHILARILQRCFVVLVSDLAPQTVTSFGIHPAKDMQQALQLADSLLGHSKGNITVIPEGISVIIKQ